MADRTEYRNKKDVRPQVSFVGSGGGVGSSENIFLIGGSGLPAPYISQRVDSETDPSRWYALYVRSRHEKVVEGALRGKGYATFSPFYRTRRKRVDRVIEIDVPLFPGYVFCQLDVTKRLPVLMTPGIVQIVPANHPEPVADSEISSIRTLAMSGRPVQPWPFLSSGQRIRMMAGPLVGAEGIFLRVKDQYQLIVSVTLLQRAVSVAVEKDAVEPLFLEERSARTLRV